METPKIDLDNIEAVEPKSSFDATKYEGYRAKIAKVEPKQVPDLYPNGEYDAKSEKKKWVAEIITEPLKVLDANGNPTDKVLEYAKDDGTTANVFVTHRFNLKEEIDPISGASKVTISKHKKGALWMFMRKMSVNKLSELNGKIVTLTTKASSVEGDDRRFLKIVTS